MTHTYSVKIVSTGKILIPDTDRFIEFYYDTPNASLDRTFGPLDFVTPIVSGVAIAAYGRYRSEDIKSASLKDLYDKLGEKYATLLDEIAKQYERLKNIPEFEDTLNWLGNVKVSKDEKRKAYIQSCRLDNKIVLEIYVIQQELKRRSFFDDILILDETDIRTAKHITGY